MKYDFRKLFGLLAFVALVAALCINADGPADDIRNGWYPQVPPISSAELNAVVACLVTNGAPPNPEVFVERISNLAGGPGVAPMQLVWRTGEHAATINPGVESHGPRVELRTDAVLTYLSPNVAYADIARAFGLPAKWITCATPETVIVRISNPVGAEWPEKCATCARSASGDVFEIGATFSDGRGTWIKRRGWNLFVWYGYWERQ